MLNEPIWRRLAACRDLDPSLFYRSPGEGDASWLRKERAAKAVCQSCPARPACRDLAIANREFNQPDCVWGGLNADELRADARARRRRRAAG